MFFTNSESENFTSLMKVGQKFLFTDFNHDSNTETIIELKNLLPNGRVLFRIHTLHSKKFESLPFSECLLMITLGYWKPIPEESAE